MCTRWAIICGHHINAYSIAVSLLRCGWQGRIVCLRNRPQPGLMDLFGRGVEVWDVSDLSPPELLERLQQHVPAGDRKVIFFTHEAYHEAFVGAPSHPWFAEARFFVGSKSHLHTILDRYEFYRFVSEHTPAEVPRTIAGHADPWSVFPHGFCLRARYSWQAGRKLPRVMLVRDRKEHQRAVQVMRTAGLEEDDWCYQEILSVAARHNISVCGWHESGRCQYWTTRKVLQHPPRVGNGDVCEFCAAAPGMTDAVRRLLDALEYMGPFEVEFVFDRRQQSYKIIELNPRFWMQHGLIEAVSGDVLVRRYAGLPLDGTPVSSRFRYWVNTLYAVYRAVRGDLRVVRYLCTTRAVRQPTARLAACWLRQRIVQRTIDRHE